MKKRTLPIRFDWTIGRKIPVLMVTIAALSCGAVALFAAKSSFSTTQILIGSHLDYIASTKRDILATKLAALQSEVRRFGTQSWIYPIVRRPLPGICWALARGR